MDRLIKCLRGLEPKLIAGTDIKALDVYVAAMKIDSPYGTRQHELVRMLEEL